MIDAKELRIGNLVNFSYPEEDAGGSMIGVSDDRRIQSGADIQHVADWPDMYNGIHLTSEILNKCSGQYSVIYFQPDYKNELISMRIDELEIIIRVDKPSQTLQGGVQVRPPRWSKEVPWIQYLHQLQNLFYCLTGQELEVKL